MTFPSAPFRFAELGFCDCRAHPLTPPVEPQNGSNAHAHGDQGDQHEGALGLRLLSPRFRLG